MLQDSFASHILCTYIDIHTSCLYFDLKKTRWSFFSTLLSWFWVVRWAVEKRNDWLTEGRSLETDEWVGEKGVRHSRRGWFQGRFRSGVRWQLDALVRSTVDGRIRFSAHIHIRLRTRAHARVTHAELVSAWWISRRPATALCLSVPLFFSTRSPSLCQFLIVL